MVQKIRNVLLTLTGTTLLLAPVAAVSPVFADGGINGSNTTGGICNSINGNTGGVSAGSQNLQPCGSTDASNTTIENTLKAIVNILSIVVGVVAVIMIIVAGFKYITSGGSEQNVSSAKNALLYAIIGLVIVALAQIIVRFVVNRALGATSSSTGT